MNCQDCNLQADVLIEGLGLCAECYCKRVTLMRRNADHLVYDNGVWREANAQEREMRARVDASIGNRRRVRAPQRALQGMRHIRGHLGGEKACESE